MTLRRDFFYALFVVLLLTTEFYYINVGGGVARIYHFASVVILVSLVGGARRLFASRVFLVLVAFVFSNLVSVALSDSPERALASLLGLLGNVSIAASVALVLLSRKMSLPAMMRVMMTVTKVSVLFAIVQIIAGEAGLILALSPEQEAQIAIGFGAAFRTEANTFCKYLIVPFLIYLPAYFRGRRDRQLTVAYGLMIAGMLMNFTRSAFFGLCAALLFMFFRYLRRGRMARIAPVIVKASLYVGVAFSLVLTGAVQVSDYARYKIENLLNQEEIIAGESSEFRLAAMQAVLDRTLEDGRRIVFGNGWGQTYVELRGEDIQAGGGDLVNAFGYGGAFGAALYLFLSVTVMRAFWRSARQASDPTVALFSEGLLFAFVGVFVTSQMSGYFIAPEYWLLVGVACYLSVERKVGFAQGHAVNPT